MRRLAVFLIVSLLIGCSAEIESPAPGPAGTTQVALATSLPPTELFVTEQPTAEATSPATVENTPLPTATPTAEPPTPTSTPVPTAQPTATAASVASTAPPAAAELSLSADDVFVYPVPQLTVGDFVTFQVKANVPPGLDPRQVGVRILVDGEQVVDGNLGWRNLADEAVGLYEWVWQATSAGPYTAQITVDPDDQISAGDLNPADNSVTVTLDVDGAIALLEAGATWETVETAYADIYVVSGTAAARDLEQLAVLTDDAIETARSQIGVPAPDQPLRIYFIDRVFGQGGYAGSEMVVSYSDRNYAGGGLFEVIAHEAIHLLDASFEPNPSSRFLVEGLAVWATGGHYKQEDLHRRAAALIESGRDIPLDLLMDDFYPAQHEIGYLTAGAVIQYLVDTYGWERVREFYSTTQRQDGEAWSQAISRQLQTYFGKTLAQFEADWRQFLSSYPVAATDVEDLEATIRFYELMRRYQQQFDPTAFYLQAWLPYPSQMLQRDLTADVTRRAQDPSRVALEALLQAADLALRSGDYDQTGILLDSVERVLASGGGFQDPIAAEFLNIVTTTETLGYVAQRIQLDGATARVLATRPGSADLARLDLRFSDQGWVQAR